ncbi:DUF2884 family protein [Alteromonas lipolytica]|uniref:DUF2884 domain-containing protein n=1 Tax=Alteromonas lipolytica TaxID=1856405 RepID=A0A1E8FEM3_9ALTE|nr:DUF2884 family protein [Alteromonas lipolytica]OFI33933.1 hypothetical protein BFC17_20440 [Alteromonas lipolytica]GGF67132.1 hypothetical protein GCM10011338_19140 [Alteromonas lipolytica]
MKSISRLLFITLFGLASGFSNSALAHYSCDVDLKYGVVVNDDQLRVLKEYVTLYQINHQNQLFVRGEWLKLNDEQAALVSQFSSGLHSVVPQVTLLATTGIDLAAETVQQMFLSLLGSNHDSYEKLNDVMDKMKKRVRRKFQYARSHYYLGPTAGEGLDDEVEVDLVVPLSKTLTTSIGSILTTLGAMDSDKLAVDQTEMAMINQRIAHYAANTDGDGPPQGTTLPEKARWYCDYFGKLDALEQQMQKSIPQLGGMDLIYLKPHKD